MLRSLQLYVHRKGRVRFGQYQEEDTVINKKWVFIFVPVLLLTVVSSLVSLLSPDFYFRDSAIIAMKSNHLDMVNLGFVVPLGIVMFVLALKDKLWAKLFILGIMANLAFMFGFNAFSLFFNELFLVYVAIFSLTIFGIILGYRDVRRTGDYSENRTKIRVSACFLMLFAVTAYTAWLIEVITSTVNGNVPESIAGMNLPSSVVHVFDMSLALPMIIIGALMLFQRKTSGLIVSSITVTFTFLICISILWMELALQRNGMSFDPGKLYSMYVLSPLSIYPLVTLHRAVSKLP